MRLKLLAPTRVVVDEEVHKIVAEGEHGSFCLLPRHVDLLASLVPGLLAFVDHTGSERFAAVDEGLLVKCGESVVVATRQAVRGDDLEALRRRVRDEFAQLDERERAAQVASSRLEASFWRGAWRLLGEQG